MRKHFRNSQPLTLNRATSATASAPAPAHKSNQAKWKTQQKQNEERKKFIKQNAKMRELVQTCIKLEASSTKQKKNERKKTFMCKSAPLQMLQMYHRHTTTTNLGLSHSLRKRISRAIRKSHSVGGKVYDEQTKEEKKQHNIKFSFPSYSWVKNYAGYSMPCLAYSSPFGAGRNMYTFNCLNVWILHTYSLVFFSSSFATACCCCVT